MPGKLLPVNDVEPGGPEPPDATTSKPTSPEDVSPAAPAPESGGAEEKQATDHQAASRSERRILERIWRGGFAVALSGGGHRATLAAAGALLALVDRRLNRHVMQIASISGGSIANAYFAQRCDFDVLEPGGLDPLAAELATTVVERGALTRGWILAIFFGAGLVWGTAAALLIWAGFGTLGGLAIAAAVWLGLVVGLGMLLWGGHIIEWLLDRRYFRPPSGGGLKPHSRALVNSLAGRRVDHVFGMTDLVLGQPVYVSCQQGGMAYRRLGTSPDPIFDTPPFQTFDVGEWSIAGVVRASAAFPGIPPRRVRVPRDPRFPDVTPSIAFLGDGGIWNNLGTQVLRESKFLGIHSTREHGIPRPFGSAPNMPLLIVNGSAPLKPAHTLPFYVPGIAQLSALFQTAQILSANTVEPRVNEFVRSFLRRVWRGRRPDHMDPLDLVVDLRDPLKLASSYAHPYEESLIRLTDEAVRNWERDVLLRVRHAIKFRDGSSEDSLGYILNEPEPRGSYPAPGFAEIEGWDTLTRSQVWKALVHSEGGGRVDAPTTLGRIEAGLARRIVARAYLNTFLASLYLAPLGESDLARLESLPGRLDLIIRASAVS